LHATFKSIRSLTVNGGSGGNDFVDAVPAAYYTTFNGGTGANTLSATEGYGHWTTWVVTGPGSGHVGKGLFFTGMRNLSGVGDFEAFKFAPGGSIAGTITGGGGLASLNYSLESAPVTVNLQTEAAPQVNGGAPGGFSGISWVAGSTSTANTLIGPNVNTDWTISAANGGSGLFGSHEIYFTQIQNLVGGTGVDVFKFVAGGSLAGSLNGGGAPAREGDWLDYTGLTTSTTVNLRTGSATGVAGGAAGRVTNIQDVHGGNGPNVLTGDSQGNILIGGTGSDTIFGGTGASLLIGGAGSDHVTGGSGDDILIGDAITFDVMTAAHEAALMSILAEWQSTDSYATRVHDIDTGTGGGLNGTAKLNFGTTVVDDGAADTITGTLSTRAINWFFKGASDTLVHVQSGEHINNT
jgi:hypothetical protein